MDHRFKDYLVLFTCTMLFFVLCFSIVRIIGIDFDFKHRLYENYYCLICLLSVLLWIVLLIGFLRFDGKKNSWYKSIFYDLFPYKDKMPHGKIFRDIVFPSLLWSISFMIVSPPLLIVLVLALFCIPYLFYKFFVNLFFFAFNSSLFVFIVLCAIITILFLLAFFHKRELSRSRIRYNYLTLLRTLFCVFAYAVGYLFLVLGIIKGVEDFFCHISDSQFISIAKALFYPFIDILPGASLLYLCHRNLNFLLYAEDSFLLYLRSFQFDSKEDSLMKLLPNGEKSIMRIGNPLNRITFSNLLSNRNMYHDVLYLPSTNWKQQLDYYIYKSYSVISVVDETQGVLWEMFYHPEYYYKILFYVDSNEKLSNIELILEKNEDLNLTLLFYCIQYLNRLGIRSPFVFWIKDNKCYFDTNLKNIAVLLTTKLNLKSDCYFEIDSPRLPSLQEKDKSDNYRTFDEVSKWVTLIRRVCNWVSSKFPVGLFLLIMSILYLFWIVVLIGTVWIISEVIFREGDILKGIGLLILVLFLLCSMIYGVISIFRKH